MRFARELPLRSQPLPAEVAVALGLVSVVASAVTIIGSDLLWLPAMGEYVRSTWSIPRGIPFAAAPSGSWVNTTVLGQLVLSAVYLGGSSGLVVTQVLLVLGALAMLAKDAVRRGARPSATALVVVAVAVGTAASFFIARAQMLSFVPFATLVVLLRRQQDKPTLAIWWAVPLVALWGNLHGAVLVGVSVLGCYLLFSRLRVAPVTAVAVGAAALVATCLNPGLWQAPRYYLGVFSGAATRDDGGMWSRLSPSNPFDVLLVLVAVGLGAAALRRRRPLWEYAAGLGLVVATASAARHGVWLLLFLAVPAALSPASHHTSRVPVSCRRNRASRLLAALLVLVSASGLVLRAPSFRDEDLQAMRIVAATRGHVILAPEPLVESLAAAGATVWASNPLDAFDQQDQTAYLAFLRGDATGAKRALDGADVVVARPGSTQLLMASGDGYTDARRVGTYFLLRRG